MKHLRLFSLAFLGGLLASAQPAAAQPLSFTNVAAPAINCVFSKPVNKKCTVTVTDSIGTIPIPPGVTGVVRLQTRTFSGAAGTPGAGKTAYLYRVDLTQAVSQSESPCVTDLAVDFGPVAKLPYTGNATLYDIFVITGGAIGSVGLFSAEQTGNSVDVVFNQPVCAGASPGTGRSSYFIGIASATPPHAVTAHVGWPGLLPQPVAARAPGKLAIPAHPSRPL
ncbi:MAG TPA: hypothetical protein VII56_05825 [Rhizomicrobium sp.]